MARVRFLGPEPVSVPELGSKTVHPDEVVEVPDRRFEGYVCQTTWEAVEEPKAEAPPSAAKKTTASAKAAATSKEG
ncbi:hypothetical protein [Streptomyces sp. NPDC005953]|uniref:hypothetical protein n=1 Tax=Streptomyces sp. NPDC005953 TaxID=3156719 RepID=UPI003402F1FC